MSKKLCKKHWKIIKKVIPNRCQNHEKTMKKTIKNSIQKKGRKTEVRARNPGKPRAPVRVTIGLQKDNKRKTTWRRGVQRGACRGTNLDPLTRLGRLRARSGYIGAKDGSGYPAFGHTKLRVVGGSPPVTDFWTRFLQLLTLILELRKTCWYFC